MNIFMAGLSADVNFEWTLMGCECAPFGNVPVDGRERAWPEFTKGNFYEDVPVSRSFVF